MTSFREVRLSNTVPGRLLLHSMPGRYEPLDDTREEVRRLRVSKIICLAPLNEIRAKSPDYAQALSAGAVPCALSMFPVCDYQAPDDEAAFRQVAIEVAKSLGRGENVLVHCGAGIGRTGMFAIAILMVLGLHDRDARRRVADAGSSPERAAQEEALRRFSEADG